MTIKLRHNFTHHKYNVGQKARRTRFRIVFNSIREADYCDQLKLLKQLGDVVMFLRQTPSARRS